MKLHRLHLRDVKGVADRTVDFPDSGVVVIEGPNEIGKTTLLEAIDLLLDPRAKATSQSRAVRALQPLGRDVGPFVEAELTVGRHRLRFAKQWLRGASTELEVLHPVREQHSGEAAQQRLDAILAESLDRPLWDALRFTQAGELGQVALTDSAVLTEALDGASGVELHAADSAPLLDQVEQEFRRYYTATGRVTGELKAAVTAASAARDEAVHAHQAVVETEQLLERHAGLRDQAAALAADTDAVQARLATAREHATAVQALLAAHEQATAALARARADSIRAHDDLRRRERSAEDLADAEARLTAAREAARHQREELTGLQEAGEGLERARDDAARTRDRASEVAERAAADVDLSQATQRCEELTAALERVGVVRADVAAAQEQLAAAPVVDEALVRSIEVAETAVLQQQARLDASTARVVLAARGPARSVVVNGEQVDLGGGESTELPVGGGLRLDLPDHLQVTIQPEVGTARLADDLEQSRVTLTGLLERAGVPDLAAARSAAATRAVAATRVRELTRRLDDLLGGGDEGALRAELDRLRDQVAESQAARPSDVPLPADAATARAVSRAAATELKTAATALADAEQARSAHVHRCTRLEGQVERATGVNEEIAARLERDRAALAEARADVADEALHEAVRTTRVSYGRLEAQVGVTLREVEEADVEGVRARLEQAERAATDHRDQVGRVQRELDHVQGQVELVSGEGRQEAYLLAVDEFLRLKAELETVHRRARAAKLLRETLGRHRDTAHRAYVRPYQEELRRLGSAVYGSSFDVEVAEDLTIAARTLEGITVPFDQLSGGAREQLGILSRLAVAGLVESGAGVPVIIDDALGYTDPDRLQRVSSVLAAPGDGAQVVLLTCTPERYGRIEGATTIRLTA